MSRARAWTLQMAALMGAGSFAVHQLRFALSPAHDASSRVHGYLAPLGLALVGLLLLALAAALARVARGMVDEAPRFRRMWTGTSASLIAVYCVQESIEGLLAHGDSAAVFARGGWVALPLAVAMGLAIALVMRGAAAASAVAATGHRAHAMPVVLAPYDAVLQPWSPRRSRATARHLAARGPPLASA
jgi:hypothetical protein